MTKGEHNKKDSSKKKRSSEKFDTKISKRNRDKKNLSFMNMSTSSDEYRLLFERSPLGIFYFNTDFKITNCNDKLSELLKTEKEKLIGLDFNTLNDKSILTSIEDSLNGKHGFYEGFYRSTLSNSLGFISLRTFPLTNDNGDIIGGVGIAEDETEQKKVKEALSLSENRYKILSSLTTDAASILTIEEDGTLNRKWLNDKLLRQTGYELHEIDTFEKWAKIVHPDDKEAFNKSVKCILSGEKVSLDFRVIDKWGKVIWINNTVYPEKNKDGKVVGLISAVRNISSQKEAEQEIIKQKSILDLIISNAPVGIWVTASDGSYPLINKMFRDAVGYESGNLSISEKELEQCRLSDKIAMETKETIRTEEELTFIDGEKHINQILKTPLYDENGDFFGVLGISNDITERKLYEKELSEAVIKVEEADKLKSAFLANMSHEIRTPLNGIIGFSKYLRDYSPTESERMHILDIICGSADHLLNIINDIIDISKLDSGQVKINPVTCELNKLLYETYNFFYSNSFELSKKEINFRLSTSLPDSESVILTDDFRLKQVLNNLLSNALKFTQNGTIEFGYTIDESKTKILFFVKDSGRGIPEDKLDIIFERFRQVDDTTTRQYGGTGLGLAISKSLVELMGGEIWVESEFEKGSIFHFSVPFIPIDEKPKFWSEDCSLEKYNNAFKGKKILVVDDDNNSYLYLKTLLEKLNANILKAENGQQAVDIALQGDKIDLILMDIQLPVLNGYEAIKEIRKYNQTLPIIAQTANAFTNEKEMCKKLGCNNFIAKPIDPNDLYRIVYEVLINGKSKK